IERNVLKNSLVLLLLLAAPASHAATARISDLTPVIIARSNDLLEISVWNGSGYNSRSVNFSNLANSVIALVPVTSNGIALLSGKGTNTQLRRAERSRCW